MHDDNNTITLQRSVILRLMSSCRG